MYDVKVVHCGELIEVFKYSNHVQTEFKMKSKKSREQTEEIKEENLQRSIKRTKRKIFQLVNSNYVRGKSSFLTITFKENLTDYDVAFDYWKRFKQKVEYNLKIKLEYCGVVEFQERGAIHFHICLFNIPYIKQEILLEYWNSLVSGGVNIKGIKDSEVDNIGAYMTYYMNKDLENSFGKEEYKGRKRYFYSRNLKKPTETYFDLSNQDDYQNYYEFAKALEDKVVFGYNTKFERKEKTINETICQETGEIKKIASENILYQQELKYRQILLNKKNNDIRKKEKYQNVKVDLL